MGIGLVRPVRIPGDESVLLHRFNISNCPVGCRDVLEGGGCQVVEWCDLEHPQEESGCLGTGDERIRSCLLYTSDAADDLLCVDLGGRRIMKKKKISYYST